MGMSVWTESPTQHGLLSVTELGVCKAFNCFTSSSSFTEADDEKVTLLAEEYTKETLRLLMLGVSFRPPLLEGKICRQTLGVDNGTVVINGEVCIDGAVVRKSDGVQYLEENGALLLVLSK